MYKRQPGNLNSEMGCAGDWDPGCDQAQLALDPKDLVWKLSLIHISEPTRPY